MIEAGVLERSVPNAEAPLLERLFDTHQQRLYRLARRLSSSREEAEDLVQETFLRVAGSPSRVPDGETAEQAWLVRVMVNLARDSWRRRRVRSLVGRASRPSPSATPSPEAGYLARLAVQDALSRLAPRRRAIVVLHELDGLDARDIAGVLGVSAVTVRWHLSRARRELAHMLRTDGDV